MDNKQLIADIQKAIGITIDGIAGKQTLSGIFSFLFKQAPTDNDPQSIIRALQKEIGVTVDGIAGTDTWNGLFNRIFPATNNISANINSVVDSRSQTQIDTLHPSVKPFAVLLIQHAGENGITIKIINGLRTFAEQDALFEQGRTTPGIKCTNAKGGFSNHNFGLAFDIGVFENNEYQKESPSYGKVGAIGVSLGLTWGGNWISIKDEPHFELRPKWAVSMSESDMLTELRRRTDVAQDFFA